MKIILLTFCLILIGASGALADEKDPFKPVEVNLNQVKFEIEGVTLTVYRYSISGEISTGEIRRSQIHDPDVKLPKELKYRAIKVAAAIFVRQEKVRRRRAQPRPLLDKILGAERRASESLERHGLGKKFIK